MEARASPDSKFGVDPDHWQPCHLLVVPGESNSVRTNGQAVTPRFLRTREAAKYLGVSPRTLRRLAQEGQIPVVQINEGSPWLFDLTDLTTFALGRKRDSPWDRS